MQIESIIRRPGGSVITLDDTDYHFTPAEDGRHLATVDNQAHAARLLEIRLGYRAANPADTLTALGFDQADASEIEGPFFIVRGAQDLQAFAHWAAAVLANTEEPNEYVLLIDKIAVGEASLAGFIPAPELMGDIHLFGHEIPPAPALSPRKQAANTILPDPGHDETGGDSLPANGADMAGGVDGPGDIDATTTQTIIPAGKGQGDDDGGEDSTEDASTNTPPPVADPASSDREALAMEYDELFGHRPNGRWTAEKIAQAIAEKKASL